MKPPKSQARLALLTLLFALAIAQPALAQVRVQKVFADLSLGPDQSGTWFLDNVDQSSVRWFTAVPLGKGATCVDCPFADNDQLLEITKVFHLLKGQAHARDGTGGQRTLQVNVTVHNLDPVHPVQFEIYMAEARSH